MKKYQSIRHEFVEYMPTELEDGVVYVSVEFATASHLCFCGCGNRVVTPISPADWQLIFDGEAISLSPSIGSWQLPCQSHYWIRRNAVQWCGKWSTEQIERGRMRDQLDRVAHFDATPASTSTTSIANRQPKWKRLLPKWVRNHR